MLPMLDLDDRMFERMVDDARKAIPKIFPQWTDENFHDPGITFIELFAWLTELQQYYLNRITEENERKFLKMLGIRMAEAGMATSDVTFSNISREYFLPRGTKLIAKDQPFETEQHIWLAPARLDKVIVRTLSESNDYSSSNGNDGVSFYAFGATADRGNRLHVGFDRPLPENKELNLAIKLFEDYPVPIGGSAKEQIGVIPTARVSWKFYGGDERAGWLPLDLIEDETMHLSRSGQIRFRINTQMQPTMIHPATERRRYWICCTIEEEGYEISPKVELIHINTVSVVQRDTLSQMILFSSDGQPNQSFQLNEFLTYYGNLRVQVQEDNGTWKYWRELDDLSSSGPMDNCYIMQRETDPKRMTLSFGNGTGGRIPKTGTNSIRVITYAPTFEESRLLGRSNGLPKQTFQLFDPHIIIDSFRLQIGKPTADSSQFEWEDWVRVDDFDNSNSSDRHFTLDPITGKIHFGDNENGWIPPVAEQANIEVISYQVGGGERGNVKRNLISEWAWPDEDLQQIRLTNYRFAAGGSERETIQAAKLRSLKELRNPDRAITSDDYEQIVHDTPGLRVARVKAIPLYQVGMRDYPRQKAPAQVTVVVVPYGESNQPMPGAGFLATVKRHLDRYRLVTTAVHVVPPQYVKITVHAVVAVDRHRREDTQSIIAQLNRLLTPLDRPDGSKGWEFGRTVYKGDLYGAINRIDGVRHVQDLWLDAEGAGIIKDTGGDVRIPPYALVYSGDHQIELLR